MQAAIQTALFARLNGASLGATVVDYMPQVADGGSDVGFPYVVMGRIIFTESDTQTRNGGTFVARIHTHTRDGSMVGCKAIRSEEHTSELQSRQYLVCRLLLEKKKSRDETQ